MPCGICVFSMAFVLGLTDYCQYDRSVHVDWGDDSRIYAGVLQEYPVGRNRSFLLKIRLADCNGQIDGSEVYLYVPENDSVFTLRPGMCCALTVGLMALESLMTPDMTRICTVKV